MVYEELLVIPKIWLVKTKNEGDKKKSKNSYLAEMIIDGSGFMQELLLTNQSGT